MKIAPTLAFVAAIACAVPAGAADVSGIYKGTFSSLSSFAPFSAVVEGPLQQVGEDVSGSLTVGPDAGALFADTFPVVGRFRRRLMVLKGTGTNGAWIIVRARQLPITGYIPPPNPIPVYFRGRLRIRTASDVLRGTVLLQLVPPVDATTTTTSTRPSTTSTTRPSTTTTTRPSTTSTTTRLSTTSSTTIRSTTTSITIRPTTTSSTRPSTTSSTTIRSTTTTSTTVFPTAGQQLFNANCAVCHGSDARGDIGPNIRCKTNIAPTVKSGKGSMPAFPQLSDADIAAIQAYLRYLCATP